MARVKPAAKPSATRTPEAEKPTAPPAAEAAESNPTNPTSGRRPPIDDFPQPPARRLGPDEFFGYLASLPKRAWSQVTVYVYRLWPICHRPRNNRYIDKIGHPFNVDALTKTHGSGDYKLILTAPAGGTNQPGICETKVEIRNPDYDPILNYDELDLGHQQNKSYVAALRRQGIIPAETQPPAPPAAAGGGDSSEAINSLANALIETTRARPNETAAAMKQTLEMLALGHRQAVELALSQIKNHDPQAQILPLIELVLKQQPAAGNTMKEFLAMFELVERLRPAPAPQSNPFEEIERSMGLMERFTKLAPGKETSGLTWPDVLIRSVEVIAPVIGNVLLALGTARLPPEAAAQVAGIMRPPTATPNPAPPTPPATTGETEAERMNLIHAYLPLIRQRVAEAVHNEGHGGDFAQSVIDMFGPATYEAAAAAGADQLYQTLIADPALKQFDTTTNGRMRQFVEEFVQYGTEPPPATAAAPNTTTATPEEP